MIPFIFLINLGLMVRKYKLYIFKSLCQSTLFNFSYPILPDNFQDALKKKEDLLLNKSCDETDPRPKRLSKKKVYKDCVSGAEFSKESDNGGKEHLTNDKSIYIYIFIMIHYNKF